MSNVDVESTIYSISREDEEKQAEDLAKINNLPYSYLVKYPVLADILYLIPPKESLQYNLVSYLKAGDKLKVATYKPDLKLIKPFLQILQNRTGLKPILTICSKNSFNYIIYLYQTFQQAKETKQKIELTKEEEAKFKIEISSLKDLKEKIQSVSTTHLLDIIFAGASSVEASDIHLEPAEKEMTIRYRIDGVLQNVANLPMVAHKSLISRIKYLAKLKIDIHNIPQDGRFDATTGGNPIDVRISTLPTSFGEAIVMRLLYHDKKFMSLEELGFAPDYLKIIQEAINKPHGIIFNTGPTGSGKTTTLYAIIQKLNKPGVKIITLEDPIEYRIAGIDQAQVDPKENFTFATGLRSILRQDPDIIMVGEIRDQETAEITFQASLTGHLVLTTLHTNNAPGAFPRLLDIGVRPYLIGGAINLVIAQRLIRKICQKCAGRGCEVCNKTGYKGRTTIAELVIPNIEIESLIKKEATLREFSEAAKKTGMRTMYEDGMLKVKQGITSDEEVLRVTRE